MRGGIGRIIIILIIAFIGGDPGEVLKSIQPNSESNTPYVESEEEKELVELVSVVLSDTEDVWTDIFEENGLIYEEPILVLYTNSVQSACGAAGASVGPFYCPGDFVMAYVVAHEVGHHVQTLLGTTDEIMPLRQKLSETEFNKYQVQFELQADYFAGVWAHYAQGMNLLEKGDLEEALTAASAIGDDTLQKRAQGYVVPESFTHGTSEERRNWFYKGFENGTIEGGNTFNSMN